MDDKVKFGLADGEMVRRVPGYEEFYAASSHGRIFSLSYRNTGVIRELAQSELTDRRRCSPTKYKRAKMSRISSFTPVASHRIIAQTFIPNPYGFSMVNHIDGDKGNNYASNLEWTNNAANQRHAFALGLNSNASGEDHHNAKLTASAVKSIREELGVTPAYRGQLTDLAARYGVTIHAIFDIKKGRSWAGLV